MLLYEAHTTALIYEAIFQYKIVQEVKQYIKWKLIMCCIQLSTTATMYEAIPLLQKYARGFNNTSNESL